MALTAEGWIGLNEKEAAEAEQRRQALEAERIAKAEAERDRWKAEYRDRQARQDAQLSKIIDGDATVKAARRALDQADQQLADLGAVLQSTADKIETLRRPDTADYSKAQPDQLLGLIGQARDAELQRLADLSAAQQIGKELERRRSEASAVRAEAQAAVMRAERLALHRWLDERLTEIRPTVEKMAATMREIRTAEDAIRERGGARQPFGTVRSTAALIELASNYDRELAEIRRFSEQYD